MHAALYALQDKLHRIFSDHYPPIPYWAEGGTLLGAVRHKGLIPWDDDLDLGVWKTNMIEHFRGAQFQELLRSYELEMYLTDAWRCKIYPRDGKPVRKWAWKFPSADLYAFEWKRGESRLVYGGPAWQQRAWGQVAPTARQASFLQLRPFGASEVWTFQDAKTYLDRIYGPNWPFEAKSHGLDHQTHERLEPVRWRLTAADCQPAQPVPSSRLPPMKITAAR